MQPPLLLEIRFKIEIDPGRCHRGMLAMPGDIVANAIAADHTDPDLVMSAPTKASDRNTA
jgi:hypothetical protein